MKIEWENEIPKDMYYRLCECRNRKSDIVLMAKVIKRVNNWDNETALDYMLEWVTGANGQLNLYPSEKEYNKMLDKIGK